jgi:hypothetical protein
LVCNGTEERQRLILVSRKRWRERRLEIPLAQSSETVVVVERSVFLNLYPDGIDLLGALGIERAGLDGCQGLFKLGEFAGSDDNHVAVLGCVSWLLIPKGGIGNATCLCL